MEGSALQIDKWPWGSETIIWGFKPEHAYTLKLIQPKVGRDGCLSLQAHRQKSETWVVLRGIAWGLAIYEGKVCTQILDVGAVQSNVPGVIHRLAAVSADLQLIEASSLDAHAADKSKPKDVIRYHCYQGRACERASDRITADLITRAIKLSDEAIDLIEQGKIPPQHNYDHIAEKIAFRL